jgi:hypothetical protein
MEARQMSGIAYVSGKNPDSTALLSENIIGLK